jgi:zinc and cadmium transporter
LNTLVLIILCTLLSGVLSVVAAGVFLLLPAHLRERSLPHLVSFATGALLGAALLALIPHAVLTAGAGNVHAVGIDHCHEHQVDHAHHDHPPGSGHVHDPGQVHAAARDKASGTLVLVGDALHNTLDGVLIAAAFLTDVHLGVVTAAAIMAHEIPQEVGNFAVLLHSGVSRRRALILNLLSSLTAVVGGVVGYYALETALTALPFALSVAAASMLYVAVADLIPGLHKRVDAKSSVAQVILIGCGIAMIALAEGQAH